jgi:hypothetical protein
VEEEQEQGVHENGKSESFRKIEGRVRPSSGFSTTNNKGNNEI